MIRAWDTLPAHDERIPSGMYLAADCSLDIGAVRSSFWQELRDGLKCWEGGPLPDDVVVISATTYPPRLRPPDDGVLVISSGRSKPPSRIVWGPGWMDFV